MPRKSVRDGPTGPGTEREAAGGKHFKVVAGVGGREETTPLLPLPPPAGRQSQGVWDPFGESPQGEQHQRPRPPLRAEPRTSPPPWTLGPPSPTRPGHPRLDGAVGSCSEDGVPSEQPPPAQSSKRTAGPGGGSWRLARGARPPRAGTTKRVEPVRGRSDPETSLLVS